MLPTTTDLNPARTAHLAENMELMGEFAEELFMLGTPFSRVVREIYEFAGFCGIATNCLEEIRPALARGGYIGADGKYIRNP